MYRSAPTTVYDCGAAPSVCARPASQVQSALASPLVENAGQLWHATPPAVGEKDPGAQLTHCAFVAASGTVPAAHTVHSDDPIIAADPAAHCTHTLLPAAAAYHPDAQAAQREASPASGTEPAAHGAHAVAPAADTDPEAHATHGVACCALYRPAAQVLQTDASPDASLPAGHGTQAAFPTPVARCPAGHGWHDEAAEGPNVPAGHDTHAVLSELASWPTPHATHSPCSAS
jgi:hypothetical protein